MNYNNGNFPQGTSNIPIPVTKPPGPPLKPPGFPQGPPGFTPAPPGYPPGYPPVPPGLPPVPPGLPSVTQINNIGYPPGNTGNAPNYPPPLNIPGFPTAIQGNTQKTPLPPGIIPQSNQLPAQTDILLTSNIPAPSNPPLISNQYNPSSVPQNAPSIPPPFQNYPQPGMIGTTIPPSNPPPQNSSGIAIAPGFGMGPPDPSPWLGYQQPQVINPSTISKSIPIEQPVKMKRQFQADYDQVNIIFANNLHREIENKYRGTIENGRTTIIISHENENTAAQMQRELEELIKKYSFDENARWAFLENDGRYQLYEQEANFIIESRYRDAYYQLSQDNYQHYSLNVEISFGGANYIIEFAQIGGVHRQKRKNMQKDTIRAVKRQAAGEDLNQNFVMNYRWLWKHETGQYREYEPDATFLIEISWQEFIKNRANSIALIQGCNGNTYQIDFEKQCQFNEITKFKRPIKREVINS